MKQLRNQRGSSLITVVMLLFIVTLLGVMAIDTATTDVQITANLKQTTNAFEAAEGGVDLVVPIIEQTASAGVLTPTAAVITATTDGGGNPKPAGTVLIDSVGSNIAAELIGTTRMDPDLSLCEDVDYDGVLDAGEDYNGNGVLDQADICIEKFGAADVTVGVDVDSLLSIANAGSSTEFAAGYEGIGAGAGSGGMSTLYRITSQGFK